VRLGKSKKMTINILITGAGGPAGYSVINALRTQTEFDVKIVAADANPLTAAFYFSHKSYAVPFATDKKFVNAVIKICKKESVKYIIPTVTEELLKFALAKDSFLKNGIKVVVSDVNSIQTCVDKWKTYDFFSNNNIPHPYTYLAANKHFKFPVIIKPRFGRGSRDVYVADNSKMLRIFLKRVPSPIVQQFVEGTEYTIDTLSDLDSNVIAVVPRERIEVKAGISYKGRTIYSTQLTEYAIKIVKKLKIIGPSNIQCIQDSKNKRFLFTEVNPRFSGGLPLTIAAGVNTPLLLLKILEGKRIMGLRAYKKGIIMLRYFAEVFTKE
jgi:carbamoyl-phosphate synthase large subunit